MCHYEVVAKDTLPEVVSTYPSAKTHDSDQPGEHWGAMYVNEIGDYIDPYGTLLAVVAQRSYSPEPYTYRLWSILRRFLNVSLS